LTALGGALRADSPRDALLRLVPDDVSLCLVVNDLRGHAQRLEAAPWFKRALASPLGKLVAASPEWRQLSRTEDEIKRHLGISAPQLRDDILGDAVVLAYRHAPPGKPDQEQGLLLLRARDAELLAKVVERLNQAQEKSQELKALEPREYKGVRYFRRQDARGVHFYFLRGPLLGFSKHESMLRQVIDRLPAAGDRPGGAPRFVRQLRGQEKALLCVWLNPRAFDEDLRQKTADTNGPDERVLQTFRRYWQALDGVGLAVYLGQDLEVRVSVQGRAEALPPAFRRMIEVSAQPSELWARFPGEAIVTSVGRTDFAALDKALADFLTDDNRSAMRLGLQATVGRALGLGLDEVLPYLGPDYGYCVAAPPDTASFPHILVALRVRPGPGQTGVDQAVYKAVQLAAGLAVFGHNGPDKAPLRIKPFKQGDVTGEYLTGDKTLPAGLEPAYALKAGYLVLASSPAALKRFVGGPVTAPAGDETPLYRLSCTRLARLLDSRRQAIADNLAASNQVSAQVAAGWLDGLIQTLRLVDQIEVTQRTEPGRATWTLRVHWSP
jgi:hypothetical protein